jgi:hypothetical protein
MASFEWDKILISVIMEVTIAGKQREVCWFNFITKLFT